MRGCIRTSTPRRRNDLEYTESLAKIIRLNELRRLKSPKKKIPGFKGQATKLGPTVGDISQEEVDGFIEFVREMRQGSLTCDREPAQQAAEH
jgi:hypothetical protein